MRTTRHVILAVSLILVTTAAAAQQTNSAIMVGTIVDSTGAALPGVTVTVTHRDTNAAVEVVTDERGQYRTPPLRIGEHTITAEVQGFRRFTQQGVILNLGDVRKVDVVLQLGEISEQITVEAATPLLDAVDSTVGTVITNQQIKDLPLNGRDYLQLASLTAGTAPSSQGVGIGGQAGTQAAFLLDGQDNNNQQISTGHSGQKEIFKPSIDAIQEFKVVTNGYSAEFGRSSSGVVSVALKSGSNDLHGSLYEFFRHDALDAKNYFATEKPPYRRNQFGGVAGLPIVRDRTFFFGDIEGGVLRRSATVVSTLPSAELRNGVFSKPIVDPLTGQPFPGNQIPLSRIDPVALRILGYVPLPQTSAATNNFIYNSPRDQDQIKWDFRIDHILSPGQNFYFRYSYQKKEDGVSSPLPPDPNGNYYAGSGNERSDSNGFVLVHNKVWSPRVLSSIRGGWNRILWTNIIPDQSLTGVGIPGVAEFNPGFSQIGITGYQTLGVSNVPNSDGSENRQISGDVTWTRGAHTFKSGVQAHWLQINFLSSQRSSGIFSFNGQYSRDPFADFLLGYASSASVSKYAELHFRTPYTHFFTQDDWRVTDNLTLNLGLRYELSPPAVDKYDAIANFDIDTDPANARIVPAGEEGDSWAARALQDVNYRMFAPRIGAAYSLPDDKTVLRGGWGIFYSNLITVGGMSSLEINPPNHLRITQTTDPAKPSIVLSEGFAPDALSPAFARNVTLVSYDRSDRVPTAQQWNVNVQRQLPGAVMVEVGYSANHFENNWRSIDGNPAPPGPGNVNARRQYTTTVVPGTTNVITLANVVRIQKDGWSSYHALHTKVEKRYAKGVSLLAAYTLSKTTELAGGYQDALNIDAEVSPASNDRRHYFVTSGIYELPFGHDKTFGNNWNGVANGILGGWSVSPILTIYSGAPLNLSVNGNPSNSNGSDRPNVVGDWELDDPQVERWFNTDAFVANERFTYGNAPRNLIRGPGRVNLDISARKAFQLTATVSAEIRFESFNALNTPALGDPNTQLGNPNFGRITSAGDARSHQLAFKFIF